MNPKDLDPEDQYPPGPFDKDVIEETKKRPDRSQPREEVPLLEENFIQESYPASPKLGPFPLWLWMALGAMAIAIIWGTVGWIEQTLLQHTQERKPFLEVTNRDFSVFLWQFPDFMRSHAQQKSGYLTGFQYIGKETLELDKTEEFVVAPPDLLFLYHTWDRLLKGEMISRPIVASEFTEFLEQAEEWQPMYWKQAPIGYVNLVESKSYRDVGDLQALPEEVLPKIVRQAFLGWKNYFKEGILINQLAPTFHQVEQFVKEHPHYARNYWRNIQEINGKEVAGAKYLLDLEEGVIGGEEKFPRDQLPSFIRVALFNALQAGKS